MLCCTTSRPCQWHLRDIRRRLPRRAGATVLLLVVEINRDSASLRSRRRSRSLLLIAILPRVRCYSLRVRLLVQCQPEAECQSRCHCAIVCQPQAESRCCGSLPVSFNLTFKLCRALNSLAIVKIVRLATALTFSTS